MPDGVSYNHETVSLDGETFSRCEFRACRLIYSGGQPARFDNCKFDTCDWKLQGAAVQLYAADGSSMRLSPTVATPNPCSPRTA